MVGYFGLFAMQGSVVRPDFWPMPTVSPKCISGFNAYGIRGTDPEM